MPIYEQLMRAKPSAQRVLLVKSRRLTQHVKSSLPRLRMRNELLGNEIIYWEGAVIPVFYWLNFALTRRDEARQRPVRTISDKSGDSRRNPLLIAESVRVTMLERARY